MLLSPWYQRSPEADVSARFGTMRGEEWTKVRGVVCPMVGVVVTNTWPLRGGGGLRSKSRIRA